MKSTACCAAAGRCCRSISTVRRNRLLRSVYLLYLTLVGGMLGWVLHRDPDTYRYIPASIRTYPGAEGVAELMRARGFTTVRHYPVLGGLMAIHHALK